MAATGSVHQHKLLTDALKNRLRKLDADTWLVVGDSRYHTHASYTVQHGPNRCSPGITMTRYEVQWLVKATACGERSARVFGTIGFSPYPAFMRVRKMVATPGYTIGCEAKYVMDIPNRTMEVLSDVLSQVLRSLDEEESLNRSLKGDGETLLTPHAVRSLMLGCARRIDELRRPHRDRCTVDDRRTCAPGEERHRAEIAIDMATMDLVRAVYNANKLWCPMRTIEQVVSSEYRETMIQEMFTRDTPPIIKAMLDYYVSIPPNTRNENQPPHYSMCWLDSYYS